jgi:hypothetical protein
MLRIDTLLENKRVFNPNPEDSSNSFGIWDLTSSSISYENVNVSSRKLFVVTEDLRMRPDLISTYQIGDDSMAGSLMKINGISNPFAIDEGQYLVIPTPDTVRTTYSSKKNKNSSQSSSTTNTVLDDLKKAQENKIFKVSSGRKKFLENNIKKAPQVVLPPNVAQPGTRKFERKGRVFTFAPDAGGGGFNRPVKK